MTDLAAARCVRYAEGPYIPVRTGRSLGGGPSRTMSCIARGGRNACLRPCNPVRGEGRNHVAWASAPAEMAFG